MSEWARPGELEVFATGTTISSERGHGGEPGHRDEHRNRGAGDLLHRAGIAMFDLQARPGHRPGQRLPVTGARRGGDTDIVRPLLVRPSTAVAAAVSGRWLDQPIAGFDVGHDATDAAERDRYLIWRGALSGDHVTRIPVALHLLAAPSMVVTVLELVPQRRLRWQRKGFVDDGIEVLDRLAGRLLTICTGVQL